MGVRVVVTDTETTGLGTHDRVVEIACVTLDLDAGIVDEWSTLVNPMRDISALVTGIHGLDSGAVSAAPVFEEIEPFVAHSFNSGVVAGHNVDFDLRMITNEYARLGRSLHVDGFCTMRAAAVAGVRRRTLHGCCDEVGVALTPAHDALGDARATALLLSRLVEIEPSLVADLEAMATTQQRIETNTDRALPRTYPRPSAVATRTMSFLQTLVDSLPVHPELTRPQNSYLAVLDHALDDFELSALEADVLRDFAIDLGLQPAEIRHAHEVYLADLHHAALRDHQITATERTVLDAVAAALQLPSVPTHASEHAAATEIVPGTLVVFTGSAPIVVEGETWDRDLAHVLAVRHGLVPTTSVSRRTGLVVAARSDSMSTKAKAARELGIPVISVEEFLFTLGVTYTRD